MAHISSRARLKGCVILGCLLCVAGAGCSGGDTGGGGTTEGGSCVGQRATVGPTEARPGDRLSVRGRFFVQDCENETAAPLQDIPVTVTPAGGSIIRFPLLDAAGPLGDVDGTITLPASVQPGQAVVRVGDAPPVTITFSEGAK